MECKERGRSGQNLKHCPLDHESSVNTGFILHFNPQNLVVDPRNLRLALRSKCRNNPSEVKSPPNIHIEVKHEYYIRLFCPDLETLYLLRNYYIDYVDLVDFYENERGLNMEAMK